MSITAFVASCSLSPAKELHDRMNVRLVWSTIDSDIVAAPTRKQNV
jgi:hypothetical protein